jgi:pilus assembly protein CpaE
MVKTRPPAAQVAERGYVAAVMSAKGGVGVSTIALNLAITLAQLMKSNTIAAEFRPGNGVWGLELGYPNPTGLHNLLQMKGAELTRDLVEGELITNSSGIKLLLSSFQPRDAEEGTAVAQMEAILNHLSMLASMTVVDLGNSPLTSSEKILSLSSEAIIILDPTPVAVAHTKALIDELATRGYGKQKILTVCLSNRIRSDVQLTWSQVQETLCQPVADIFTPVPELAHQAVLRYTPMVLFQTEGLHVQQYRKLAELVAQHAHKA